MIEHCGDSPEWVLVSITWENGEQQRGLVPCSVISSIEPAGWFDTLNCYSKAFREKTIENDKIAKLCSS